MPTYMITQDTSTPITKSTFSLQNWHYKVRAMNALKAHTEAVYKGIG